MNIYEDILAKIKQIDAAQGSISKQSLFFQFTKDEAFATVAKMILDPYRMFGVREVRMVPEGRAAKDIELKDFVHEMEKLETRVATGVKAQQVLMDLLYQGVPENLLTKILKKDMGCGLGPDSANKCRKDFVPSFKVALAKEYEEGDTPLPMFVSPKFDGMRCIVMIDEENVRFLSRNGLEWSSLTGFAASFLALGVSNMVFDCEVMNGNHFNDAGVIKGKKAKADNAVFQVFDMLPLEDFMARAETASQEVRLMRLKNVLGERSSKDPIQLCPHDLAYTAEEVKSAFKRFRAAGLEGVIGKQPKAPYQFKRSNAWTKIKDFVTYDLPILELLEGEGKYVGMLGSIVVGFRGNRVKIGTGFSDKQRIEFWQDRANLEGSSGSKVIIEVSAHEVTPDNSLRHGRFEKFRWDKTLDEVNDGTDGKGE